MAWKKNNALQQALHNLLESPKIKWQSMKMTNWRILRFFTTDWEKFANFFFDQLTNFTYFVMGDEKTFFPVIINFVIVFLNWLLNLCVLLCDSEKCLIIFPLQTTPNFCITLAIHWWIFGLFRRWMKKKIPDFLGRGDEQTIGECCNPFCSPVIN